VGKIPVTTGGPATAGPGGPRWRRLRTVSGTGLLVLGVIGVALPLVPGVPFLIVGTWLVGQDHPLVRRFRRWQRGSWR
jgi:uncharacterized membrane protein YbaN (DUF454 family)